MRAPSHHTSPDFATCFNASWKASIAASGPNILQKNLSRWLTDERCEYNSTTIGPPQCASLTHRCSTAMPLNTAPLEPAAEFAQATTSIPKGREWSHNLAAQYSFEDVKRNTPICYTPESPHDETSLERVDTPAVAAFDPIVDIPASKCIVPSSCTSSTRDLKDKPARRMPCFDSHELK